MSIKPGTKVQTLARIKRPKAGNGLLPNNNYINLGSNEAAFGKYINYPQTYPLYEVLAAHFGVNIENITLTRGAEEGIALVYNPYAEPEDKTVKISPTFGMIEVFEQINQTTRVELNYNPDLSVPLKELRTAVQEKPKICYLANPNNITGSMLTWNQLLDFLHEISNLETLFILDITYLPYTDEYLKIKEILDFRQLPNLIVVVSFSKIHGIAGLRSGCVIASPGIINLLRKTQPMQEINTVAVNETITAVSDRTIAEQNILNARKWKEKFSKKFPDIYIQSEANFILLRTPLSVKIYNALLKNRIITRYQFDHPIMKDMLRISVGTPIIMEQVLRIVKEILC
jgi:histidinol-phosphate aminotransferase